MCGGRMGKKNVSMQSQKVIRFNCVPSGFFSFHSQLTQIIYHLNSFQIHPSNFHFDVRYQQQRQKIIIIIVKIACNIKTNITNRCLVTMFGSHAFCCSFRMWNCNLLYFIQDLTEKLNTDKHTHRKHTKPQSRRNGIENLKSVCFVAAKILRYMS